MARPGGAGVETTRARVGVKSAVHLQVEQSFVKRAPSLETFDIARDISMSHPEGN